MTKEKYIRLSGFGPGYKTDVTFRVDEDGDLQVHDDVANITLFVLKDELPKLHDWLNKALPE